MGLSYGGRRFRPGQGERRARANGAVAEGAFRATTGRLRQRGAMAKAIFGNYSPFTATACRLRQRLNVDKGAKGQFPKQRHRTKVACHQPWECVTVTLGDVRVTLG